MISIKKKSELMGAEKFGQCKSCSKTHLEAELYRIAFSYEESNYIRCFDMCKNCLCELSDKIYDVCHSEFDMDRFLDEI